MEKFILLFRGSDVYEAGQSPEALQKLTEKMMGWVGELVQRGSHVSSEKFKRTGFTIGGKAGGMSDLPFDNDKQIIGGCTIIQAADLDAALAIAKRCPILETNATIEVRPVLSV